MSTPEDTRNGGILFVDLDGALCATDTLWESLLLLSRKHPIDLFRTLVWLGRGKAEFKREVASRVLLDVKDIPLRPEVVELIVKRKAEGQSVVLATAADERIAAAFAARLGIFDGVLASDGKTNLSAEKKLAAVRRYAGEAPFDYIGDSSADICLLRHCKKGYFAGGNDRVWQSIQRIGRDEDAITRLHCKAGGFGAIAAALRPHQWAKNLLIAVPLVVSHQVTNLTAFWETALAFASFSATASSVYIVNDLLDLAADRAHPTKRRRPFASGALSIKTGILSAIALLSGGVTLAFGGLGARFGGILLLYLFVSTLYSMVLKRKLVLDVFVLAGLFTVRILAGTLAIDVRLSQWLLAFSMFVFASLAMVKRYSELKTWSKRNEAWPPGRGYTVSDMELFRSVGPASAYAAVLVFALYINSHDVALLYRKPEILWLVCPVLMYWMTRLWFLTNRDRALEDPVLFALTDRVSIVCGALVLGLIVLAT